MYAVTVTLQIAPEQLEAFMPLILANAQASRSGEEGCRQFDVCTDDSLPGTVFLYETYSDRAAFEAHLETAHFKAFDAATGQMIAHKHIVTFSKVVS